MDPETMKSKGESVHFPRAARRVQNWPLIFTLLFLQLFAIGQSLEKRHTNIVDNDELLGGRNEQQGQMPNIVTPKSQKDGQESAPLNLINDQQQQRRRASGRRRRIHSVSRSVNSFRSQLVERSAAQLHRHITTNYQPEGFRQGYSPELSRGGEGGGKLTRTLLTNEGIERSVILVPTAIDHPKVLTAETFAGGKIKFKEGIGKRRRRIGKRVEGETAAGGNSHRELHGKPTVKELSHEMNTPNEERKEEGEGGWHWHPINTTSVEIDFANSTALSEGGQHQQFSMEDLSPELLDRLQRFNKANSLVKGQPGKAKALAHYMREVGLLDGHEHSEEKPQISFLIDDERISLLEKEREAAVPMPIPIGKEKPAVSLRTKFPKNREAQKPILLARVDDSDMDLLSPSANAGTPRKPTQRLQPNAGHPPRPAFGQAPRPSPPHHFPHFQKPVLHAAVPQKPLPQPIIPQIVPSPPPSPALLQTQTPPTPPLQTTRHATPPPPSTNVSISRPWPVPPVPSSSPALNPNAKLELCCRRHNLPQTCQQFCNFDTFTQEKLLVALLGTQCPAIQLGKAFACAHSKVDHSECCQRQGIHLVNNGQCMVFCRTHIPTPPNVLGYVSCLSQFGTIKNCYRDHQLKYKNLFGD